MDVIVPWAGSSKKILLLGAGFVCRPTAEVLDDAGFSVTIASRNLDNAKKLAEGLKHATPISLDVTDESALDHEVSKVALVISLIPYTYHVTVIKSAIKHKKHVVTTSYVSPAMKALDAECKEAGITVMNEIGLDPGIDHLWAVKTIHEVHEAGGRIKSFWSYCGGLPAPESSDNPLGYKFSWSSRGVLLALRNAAKFFKDGHIVEVSSTELMGTAKPYLIYPGYAFVAYPNRDSTDYRARYMIPEADTIIRGTLRYQGFPEFIKTLVDLNFLSEESLPILNPKGHPASWREATAAIIGATSRVEEDLVAAVKSKCQFPSEDEEERIIAGLRWIGLFSDDEITPRSNPLDTLCATLEQKMKYEDGEKDFVMLQHKFEIEHVDGSKEVRTSTLAETGAPYGGKGWSAMAKLVGVPCAVAVKMVLDGAIAQHGVLAPVTEELAAPIREILKKEYGIELKEKTIA
ncbi:Saccharopine dehydrogenase [NADP(+), L-glutamate-forming] [Cryomyces minteri]|uniref:Saccharopine dehydrogenase [NADP(+), L-glutamate-forming] n=1 Tax=Cryomyces minteri TaxID=331657 RepID=A0A4U0XLR7_9PEZI|nr:Saccharopine dehydrogenase [NADP(+), L-glutamate-forming] [Cryomyces minteri]